MVTAPCGKFQPKVPANTKVLTSELREKRLSREMLCSLWGETGREPDFLWLFFPLVQKGNLFDRDKLNWANRKLPLEILATCLSRLCTPKL